MHKLLWVPPVLALLDEFQGHCEPAVNRPCLVGNGLNLTAARPRKGCLLLLSIALQSSLQSNPSSQSVLTEGISQKMFGVELAAMKQQRRGTGAVAAAFHLTDKDHMVALFITAAVKAFKGCGRAAQEG